MRELNVSEIEVVNGGGDVVDAAQGASAGAGVIGVAVAVGATVTAPVTLAVVAVGALIGAAAEFLSE